jgi:hypothetical protein
MPPTKAIVAREPRFSALSWALEPVHVADTPGPDEVLVEMVASGVCHTDIVLSAVPNGTFGISYPKVMGHEGRTVLSFRHFVGFIIVFLRFVLEAVAGVGVTDTDIDML